jgi:hypothetical protein
MGDVGIGPLVDALPRNTHLRELECNAWLSAAFVQDRLLPALAANTSLRMFYGGTATTTATANAFVRAREQARLRAEAA